MHLPNRLLLLSLLQIPSAKTTAPVLAAFQPNSRHPRATAVSLRSFRSDPTNTQNSTMGRGGGRGEYYRNKYGGGRSSGGRGRGGRGGGRGRGRDGSGANGSPASKVTRTNGGSYSDLQDLLQRIDGRQYPSYHDLETGTSMAWQHPTGFTLQIGRTQSDPFAPPTRCRVVVPASLVNIPPTLLDDKTGRIAAADFLWRRFYEVCRRVGADRSIAGGGGGWSGPKGGDLQIMEPTQHVFEQSAVQIVEHGVQVQLTINLPARGRSILGKAAAEVLDSVLSRALRDGILSFDSNALTQHVQSIRDQVYLQDQLKAAGLVAFVRNGAILPRRSGVDDRPLTQGRVISFQSPESLQCEFTLPHTGVTIQGMGIPVGVTIICGGGFHGKSTLLQTLQVGIYPKVPGDGREFCVTDPAATKIRAEDGRAVTAVDISPFIRNLPFGKDTTCFSTPDASGSTSQAANIVESVAMGASLLLDEDTCASNAMIRDAKMMQLVANEKEPIVPFVSVARSIYTERNCSTVVVVGGAGDFFDIADNVLMMDSYTCHDATTRAKQIVNEHSSTNRPPPAPFGAIRDRYPIPSQLHPNGKVKTISPTTVSFGDTQLDLGGMEQIVSIAQTNTIVMALQHLSSVPPGSTLPKFLQQLEESLEGNAIDDVLAPGQFHGMLARCRLIELNGAINRMRRPCIEQSK